MENSSHLTTTTIPKRTFATSQFGTTYNGHKIWVGSQIALCLITIVLTYIACCIARYAWILQRSIGSRRTTIFDSGGNREETGVPNTRPLASSRKKYKIVMAYICLFATVVTIAKCLVDQLKFFYAWTQRDDDICELLYDVTDNGMFFVAYISIYGFLWMKQWMFYRDPAVTGILYNKKLVLFSKIFAPVVFIMGVGNVVSNLIPKRFNAGNSYAALDDVEALYDDETYLGCVAIYNYTDKDHVWPLMWYAVITATFQTVLLGLFAYPILRQKIDLIRLAKARSQNISPDFSEANESKRFKFSSIKSEKKSSNSKDITKESRSLRLSSASEENCGSVYGRYNALMYTPSPDAMRPIKRAIVWTTICIATDTILFSIFAALGKGTPLILISVAQNIDLFFNILCLLATYNTWRYILFPFCESGSARKIRRAPGVVSLMKPPKEVVV